MKKLLLILLTAIIFLSCGCKKQQDKSNLMRMSEIQNMQCESIIEHAMFYVNNAYMFKPDTFKNLHKSKYDNYLELNIAVSWLNAYIGNIKTRIIENPSINCSAISDSLNTMKDDVLRIQSKISPSIRDYYEKGVENLQLNEEIFIDESDGITYNLLYLSTIQAKYCLMLSSYAGSEFMDH